MLILAYICIYMHIHNYIEVNELENFNFNSGIKEVSVCGPSSVSEMATHNTHICFALSCAALCV